MLVYILCIVSLVVVDHLLKWYMTSLLANGPIVLIKGVVRLAYLKNDGAAFGMLGGKQIFLIIFTAVLIIFLCYILFFKKNKPIINVSLIMIIAGGFGNMIDRIVQGYVVDYIEPLFVNFAVFNFADILINIGCIMFAVVILFFDKKKDGTKIEPRTDI